ncbi:MAG: hypothetical protein V8T10_02375 [Merdibacter sp.]
MRRRCISSMEGPDRSSKTVITDADSFTDFVQAYLMYDERGTAENDPSAYPGSDEAFAALQGMMPDEIWNKVDMESCSWSMSEDVLFRNHAYSAPVQIKGQTGRSWIRMSYEGQDLGWPIRWISGHFTIRKSRCS